MKHLTEYINESLKFNYDSKKKSRYKAAILKEEMPLDVKDIISILANGVKPDIKDIPADKLEKEVWEYFIYSFDEFWTVFSKYITDKEYDRLSDIEPDEKLKAIWDVWGSDIMQIFIDTINK